MKVRLLKIIRNDEDSRKPLALQFEFSIGIVTQPMSIEDFCRSMNHILESEEFKVDVEIS